MDRVYVIWNPLHEKIVCVHLHEDDSCVECDTVREKLKNTAYSLKGEYFSVNTGTSTKPIQKFCYCGNPVDEHNPDCVEFKLCKEHKLDC